MDNELSREQIEEWRHNGFAGAYSDDFTKICDMALAYLDAKKDAERIDWMQKNVSAIRDIGWLNGDLRAAIDQARGAGNE